MTLLLLSVACETTLTGSVESSAGGPVEGASLHASGLSGESDCDAVTGADGRFRARCALPATGAAEGEWTFTITHPAHMERAWTVPARRGELDAGRVVLERIPVEGGIFAYDGSVFRALPPSPLKRTEEKDAQRWCLTEGGAPAEVPAGRVRVLDNHVADWRLFRVDAEGCVYRMQRGMGPHWSWTADEVEPAATTAISEGRSWVDLDLTPGDYVFADWYAGFLVEREGGWRAGLLRVRSP